MTHAVVQWMERNPDKVAAHLPEGFTATHAQRQALALLQADKRAKGKISKCTPESLILAVLQAAALGLQLDAHDAYVIPYGYDNGARYEAELSISWQGLVKLAKRGGEIRHVEAEVVYENEADQLIMSRSVDPAKHGIHHAMRVDRGGAIVGVYAIVTLADGTRTFDYGTADEIDSARDASKASNSPAWRNWYGEMAKKFIIRRTLKKYSKDAEFARALAEDDARHLEATIVNGSGLSAQQLTQRVRGEVVDVVDVLPATVESVPPDSTPAVAGDTAPEPEPPEPEPAPWDAHFDVSKASDKDKAAAAAFLETLADEALDEWLQALKDADDVTSVVRGLAKRNK